MAAARAVVAQVTPQQSMPMLSVIVPAHNNAHQLDQCLKALRASYYVNFEIIVVDDCSTEDIRPVVTHYGAQYVHLSQNGGPSTARNLGARKATGEILVFIDSDVAVNPLVLSNISEDFLRQPRLAAVFGSYDEEPACDDFFSQQKNLMHHYIHQISKDEAVSFWAGCGAIRKQVFLEMGGFDAAQFPRPSIEDIELGYRMVGAGKKVLLDKRIQAKHLKRWTLTKLLRADIFDRAVPWAKLIMKTRWLPRDLNLGYRARLSAIFVALLVLDLVVLPFSLANFWWAPPAFHLGFVICGIVAGLVVVNHRMYRWFHQRRGFWFTLRVVLFHWFYYFYSGVVFVCCALAYKLSRVGSPSSKIATSAVESGD
jgi:glycosyltransferase involved in cell wall biosynthesis